MSASDLPRRLLDALEGVMWSATVDLYEGGSAAGCAHCGAEMPRHADPLCSCELGDLVREARAELRQEELQ